MSELKTFQGPQNQVLLLRAHFEATLAGKGGLFQGFSRAVALWSRHSVCPAAEAATPR